MKNIWKFKLDLTEAQNIFMPRGAKVLTAQNQNGDICVWAVCDPEEASKEERTFYIVGTGHPFDPDIQRDYVGTVQAGILVWHVFVEPA